MSGGWYRYNKFLVDCADLFGITTFTDLLMLPNEGGGLNRDMERLSINITMHGYQNAWNLEFWTRFSDVFPQVMSWLFPSK